MSECKKIFQEIKSDCNMPTAGMETTAYIFNRKDLSITKDATNNVVVTNIELATDTIGYKIKGYKMNMNAGHDAVISADAPNRYTHYFSFHGYEIDSDAVSNIDALEDLVIVVERKEKSLDGSFILYGADAGLSTSSDTLRMNDANSVRQIELSTPEGSTEKHSQYNVVIPDATSTYAATKALLDALVTAAE